MTGLVFDELQRVKMAIILAEDSMFEPNRQDVQRIREGFDALERAVVDALQPAKPGPTAEAEPALTLAERVEALEERCEALVPRKDALAAVIELSARLARLEELVNGPERVARELVDVLTAQMPGLGEQIRAEAQDAILSGDAAATVIETRR